MRSVETAAAVSVVQHSSSGSARSPRLTKWSQIQAVLKPASSARLGGLHPPRGRHPDGRGIEPHREVHGHERTRS